MDVWLLRCWLVVGPVVYVTDLDDANVWDWIDQVDFSKPAPLSFVRVLAEFILGTIAGELMKRAFPGDWLRQAPWLACTSSLTVSTG